MVLPEVYGWLNGLADLGLGDVFDATTLPGALATGVVVFCVAALASWLAGRLLKGWEDRVRRFLGGVDETVWRFFLHLKTFLVFLLAVIIFASLVPSLRALLGTLVAGAGVTALVIGFAAKTTLGNLVSGVALAVYRPIHIGDLVTIEDHYGTIEDISLRHTILLTWDQKRVVIPNERIDQMTLVNYSLLDPRMLLPLEVGVSYDTDIDLARALMLEEAARCPHRLAEESAPAPPWVRVVAMSDFSIVLRLYVWTPNMSENWLARFWLLEHIKKRFDQEGVEIPFPYRTLVYKKDLPQARQAPPELKPVEEASSGKTEPAG